MTGPRQTFPSQQGKGQKPLWRVRWQREDAAALVGGDETELPSRRQPQHKPHPCRSFQGPQGLKRSPLPHQGLLG